MDMGEQTTRKYVLGLLDRAAITTAQADFMLNHAGYRGLTRWERRLANNVVARRAAGFSFKSGNRQVDGSQILAGRNPKVRH